MNIYFNKKEWLIMLVITPIIIFLLAMSDIPFKYWMFCTILFPEWLLEQTLFDLVSMGRMVILAGVVIGAMSVILMKLWKL